MNAQHEHQKAAKDLPRSLSEVSRQLAGEISRAEANEAIRTNAEIAKRQSGSLGRLLERHPLLPMPADTVSVSLLLLYLIFLNGRIMLNKF